MTMHPAFLEDFDQDPQAASRLPEISETPPPADPLAAYEDGYRSGWDDATRAAEEASQRLSEELTRNLEEIGYTYFEARNEVLATLRDLLEEVFGKLLPSLAPDTLVDLALREINTLAADVSDASVTFRVSPREEPALRALLSGGVSFPFEMIAEPAVADGQVYLSLCGQEKRIDSGELIEKLRGAISLATAGNDKKVANDG